MVNRYIRRTIRWRESNFASRWHQFLTNIFPSSIKLRPVTYSVFFSVSLRLFLPRGKLQKRTNPGHPKPDAAVMSRHPQKGGFPCSICVQATRSCPNQASSQHGAEATLHLPPNPRPKPPEITSPGRDESTSPDGPSLPGH